MEILATYWVKKLDKKSEEMIAKQKLYLDFIHSDILCFTNFSWN